ncbi:MAG: hypothetical protein KDE31_08760 [Caldilineaceae bacterium]|nr:hypothetical protein [Caldilineaceae bacterium]
MAENQATPTPGIDWRKPRVEGYMQQLPSGNWARLRPVAPEALIVSGNIPDVLTPLVSRMLYEGIDKTAETLEQALSGTEAGDVDMDKVTTALKRMGEMVDAFDAVCVAAFVSPRIVAEPDADDEIAIDDLTLNDKLHVFYLATQPAEVLRFFRYEPPADVAAVANEPGDAQSPQPAGGDS